MSLYKEFFCVRSCCPLCKVMTFVESFMIVLVIGHMHMKKKSHLAFSGSILSGLDVNDSIWFWQCSHLPLLIKIFLWKHQRSVILIRFGYPSISVWTCPRLLIWSPVGEKWLVTRSPGQNPFSNIWATREVWKEWLLTKSTWSPLSSSVFVYSVGLGYHLKARIVLTIILLKKKVGTSKGKWRGARISLWWEFCSVAVRKAVHSGHLPIPRPGLESEHLQ